MKRFIPSAFATLAIPLLSMAQSSAPPPDEEKPRVPKASVLPAETVVPGAPTAVPAEPSPGQPPAAAPAAPEKPATPRQARPGRPGGERPDTPKGDRPGGRPGGDRPDAAGAERPDTPKGERPGRPGADRPDPSATERPGSPATDRPDSPDAKRRSRPGTNDATGAPSNPVTPGSGTAPEGNPSTNPERTTPGAGMDRPSARPSETPGTPPANRGKRPGTRGTAPAAPETPGTPPATPGTPPGTAVTPPAMPATPGTPPATSGTRPERGERPTAPQERGGDPSRTPATTPGAPMPATNSTPEAPGAPKSAERPDGGRNRPERPGSPERPEARQRPERPTAQQPPSQETSNLLQDEPRRDRQADAAQARKIDNQDDAKRLLLNILGAGAAAVGAGSNDNDRRDPAPDPRRRRDGFRPGYRPSFEEVGRTQQDRERAVSTIVERFQGRAPQAGPSGSPHREQRLFQTTETQRRTRFYEGNRRVIRYSSMQEIPPVIVASQQLRRVQLVPQAQSTYSVSPQAPQQGSYQNDIPPSYTTGDAYAVSYQVDPDSAISTDAILFRQGSTDFADAYSYDLVIDMANAMQAPALASDTFVIEGHASAEGDYGQNLQLSQERAERISRELVRHGVSAERLMPVGYGEAEAASPADAAEADRSLDRRVVVFRMR